MTRVVIQIDFTGVTSLRSVSSECRPLLNMTNVTVGTAKQYKKFGDVIEHLRAGGIAQRNGWNGKNMYVFKQVPSRVPAEIVPKMSSLPDSVKEKMVNDGVSPDYQNQMAIVKPDGSIDSWVASSSDTFAEDWILV